MLYYDNAFALPGFTDVVQNTENQFWWGRYELQTWRGAKIAAATTDAGNSPTDVLRSGLLLGQVAATPGILKAWAPAGTDGTQFIYGVLLYAQKMQFQGTATDRWTGYVMTGGYVKPKNLLVPGASSLSIVGNASEYLIRGQMSQRFVFADEVSGQAGGYMGGWRNVQAVTGTTYAVTAAESGTLFTNRGGGAGVAFTLPATPYKGLRYGFYTVADFALTVTAGTAETLVAVNNAAADSLAFSTATRIIGNFIEVIGDGTSWLSIAHPAQTSDGTTSGALVTVSD
jgi:hypothetical protein